MTQGFDKALASFRDYAAGVLQVAAKKVDVGPSSEAVARGAKDNAGRLFAFDATSDGKPGIAVRGWASPDGTVASTRQNLGLFFEEMGLWKEGAAASADDLAARLAWSLGSGNQVVPVFRDRIQPPALVRNPDGGGTLRFLYKQVSPPPGRPMEWVYEATVTLTADRKATWARSDNLNK